MTSWEYEKIQADLTRLLNSDRRRLNRKEREIWKEAILAAKSCLSNFNPDKKGDKV